MSIFNTLWIWIQRIVDRHRITYGIAFALLIAMLLTTISMALYVSSGASQLDLSRPGYENAREDVTTDTKKDDFSSTGPINSDVANDFQARMDAHRAKLNQLDTYGTGALDDAELQIAPGTN